MINNTPRATDLAISVIKTPTLTSLANKDTIVLVNFDLDPEACKFMAIRLSFI